jgi:hypothetical protein
VHVNNVGFSASTKLRFDKNRKFVVARDVRLSLLAGGDEGLGTTSRRSTSPRRARISARIRKPSKPRPGGRACARA